MSFGGRPQGHGNQNYGYNANTHNNNHNSNNNNHNSNNHSGTHHQGGGRSGGNGSGPRTYQFSGEPVMKCPFCRETNRPASRLVDVLPPRDGAPSAEMASSAPQRSGPVPGVFFWDEQGVRHDHSGMQRRTRVRCTGCGIEWQVSETARCFTPTCKHFGPINTTWVPVGSGGN